MQTSRERIQIKQRHLNNVEIQTIEVKVNQQMRTYTNLPLANKVFCSATINSNF